MSGPVGSGLAEDVRTEEKHVVEYDGLYIGGRWRAPSSTDRIEVRSPANGELVGSTPKANAADVDAAVAAARAAFDTGEWPRLSVGERVATLTRLRDHLQLRADELNALGTRENGVPLAVQPVLRALELFDFTLTAAGDFPFERERQGIFGRQASIVREPVGVVAAIVAANGPLLQAVGKVAPALVCGCTVVLKPPVETPLLTMALAEAAEAAGLPAGVLNVVPGDVDAGQHLVGHPDVDKVSFTGSAAAGRQIGTVCGRQLKRLTLELGGKSAAIVLPDADMDVTARGIAGGCMAYAGQRCAALSRAFVPRAQYRRFVDAIVAAVADLKVGDPMALDTFVGPLVSQRQLGKVQGHVAAAIAEGATLELGGHRIESMPHGWYFEPTVLTDATNDMQIAREEVFGPVLCVIPYDAVEEAIAMANDSQYGLTAAVFSSDRQVAQQVAGSIRAGSIGINASAGEIGLPFGGYKSSGFGREYSVEAFDSFTEVKAIA
jgi:betaine-aldehyde dehydrogenase